MEEKKPNPLVRLWRKATGYPSTTFDPMNHEMVRMVFGGDQSTSGKLVSADSIMALSTAWSCMRVLSETIGAVPWGFYKRDARDPKASAIDARDHPVAEVLLGAPNAFMTSVEFREALTLNLCQSGNTYSLIERLSDKGRLVSLTPIVSSRVKPKFDPDRREVYFEINDRGKTERYPAEKIWHVKGFGPNGMVGLSPISAARDAAGMALATDEFGARFFAQGGKPSGVATIPNFLTKEQRVIARENLQQMLGGMGNAHKFALFEGGIKPEPWGDMPLQDMEFLMLRKFNVQEICRFYRVPPHMVADLDRATFSNIEHLSLDFVMFTLMPYFTRIEASVQRWLLSPQDRAQGYFLRFNFEGLLRADSAGRSTFYHNALSDGWMSRNEVRVLENQPRSEAPGMDDYTVQPGIMSTSAIQKKPLEPRAPVAPPPAAKETTVVVQAAAPASGDQSRISMVLPEILGKDMKYLIEHPEIKKLTERIERGDAEARKKLGDIMALFEQSLTEHEAKVKGLTDLFALYESRTRARMEDIEAANKALVDELILAANRPRKVVFDDAGEPIGTVAVDSLH